MYRHVDLLNEAGVSAAVLHQRAGFRCRWFANSTRVTDVRSHAVGPTDVLVLPELDVDVLVAARTSVQHVVLNQSGHLTWDRDAEGVGAHYRSSPHLLGLVAVSEHSTRLLSYAFPHLPVRRVHHGLDSSVFHASPGVARPRRLVYLGRRGQREATQVFGLLNARDVLGGWQVDRIDSATQHELAHALQTSRLFLNFTYQEGFGLPALEAMACGAMVVGFDGFGGREFFDPAWSTGVAAGDVLAFAQAVEEVLALDAADPEWCARTGQEASTQVLARYSLAQERADVVQVYGELLAGRSRSAPGLGARR